MENLLRKSALHRQFLSESLRAKALNRRFKVLLARVLGGGRRSIVQSRRGFELLRKRSEDQTESSRLHVEIQVADAVDQIRKLIGGK